jgi:hypothetical protein
MYDEIGENVPVKPVNATGVEGAGGETCGGVDHG